MKKFVKILYSIPALFLAMLMFIPITANADVTSYTLIFKANGGTGIMSQTTVTEGQTYTFPQCTFISPENKMFSYWGMSGADGHYNPGDTILIASNCAVNGVIEVTAYWTNDLHTHDWSYTANGATITAVCHGPYTCSIKSGLTMTISAPAAENLIYDGQKKAATLNSDYNTTAFPGNYIIQYTGISGTSYNSTDAPCNVGNYKASVTAGTGDKAATAEVSFTIKKAEEPTEIIDKNQKKTHITKLLAKEKSFTVHWKKRKKAVDGYQIQYSTDKKFKTHTKTKNIKKAKTDHKTVRNLKAQKKYYVRIRTFKKTGTKTIYSTWSKKKIIKTK